MINERENIIRVNSALVAYSAIKNPVACPGFQNRCDAHISLAPKSGPIWGIAKKIGDFINCWKRETNDNK